MARRQTPEVGVGKGKLVSTLSGEVIAGNEHRRRTTLACDMLGPSVFRIASSQDRRDGGGECRLHVPNRPAAVAPSGDPLALHGGLLLRDGNLSR